MNDSELKACKNALETLHQLLLQEIEDLQQSASPVELDQQAFGRVSRGDALQQQNMAKAGLIQFQNRLQDLLHARHKFAEGEYGWCECCDAEIAHARLLARPESRFCIDCQSKAE